MTKDILLKISGMQFTADNSDPNEPEPVEIIAPGEYYFKNGKHYIIYDEVMEGFASVQKMYLSCRMILWKLQNEAVRTYIWCLKKIKRI